MTRYYRSRVDRKLAGLCGGLGELLKVDPTLIRLAVVLASILTAIVPVMIFYLVAWIIVPEAPWTDSTQPPPESPPPPPSD